MAEELAGHGSPVRLEYLIFDPAECRFPPPRLPVLPDGLAGLTFPAPRPAAPRLEGNCRHFVRARYALFEAYRLAGVGAQGALLAPSYHCRTMIDPALALDGPVLLYRLQADLAPDLESMEALRRQSPIPVRAVLATHFFGIPQPFAELANWCARHGIALVEDCSHVLYLEHAQAPDTGRHGDFVVSSPYKFIPCPDGGLLQARRGEQLASVRPRPRSVIAELKGVAHAIGLAGGRRRGPYPAIGQLDAELAGLSAGGPGQDCRRREGLSVDYRPAEEGLASLRISRLLIRHANASVIARRRRDRYARWAAAMEGMPGCRPLAGALPEGCIPYMFPLYLEDPDRHFPTLKRLGVPIWRWDSIAASDCPTARDYRRHLLHLPCHQSLHVDDLEWMIAAVRRVLDSRSGARSS